MSPYEALLAEARGRPFAAIVGWPVEHSRSPLLHGFWLRQHHVEGHYGRLWATNNDGPGATFCFALPCGSESSTSKDIKAHGPNAA